MVGEPRRYHLRRVEENFLSSPVREGGEGVLVLYTRGVIEFSRIALLGRSFLEGIVIGGEILRGVFDVAGTFFSAWRVKEFCEWKAGRSLWGFEKL